MADKWLLIETFGGEGHHEPSVIAVGRTVKRMLPLASVLRVRSVTGDWMPVAVSAKLMFLDQHTTAALVTVSAPEAAPA